MTGIKQVVKRSVFSEFLGLWGTFSYIIRGVNYLSTKTRHIYGTHENCLGMGELDIFSPGRVRAELFSLIPF